MPDVDTPKKTAKPHVAAAEITPAPANLGDTGNTLGNKVATVAIVGLGVALIEAELIPGMLLGVAAMLVPDLFPRLGRTLRPLVKGTIRAGWALADRARETVAEAGEHMEDIVAEVKAEQSHAQTVAGAPHTEPAASNSHA